MCIRLLKRNINLMSGILKDKKSGYPLFSFLSSIFNWLANYKKVQPPKFVVFYQLLPEIIPYLSLTHFFNSFHS